MRRRFLKARFPPSSTDTVEHRAPGWGLLCLGQPKLLRFSKQNIIEKIETWKKFLIILVLIQCVFWTKREIFWSFERQNFQSTLAQVLPSACCESLRVIFSLSFFENTGAKRPFSIGLEIGFIGFNFHLNYIPKIATLTRLLESSWLTSTRMCSTCMCGNSALLLVASLLHKTRFQAW